MKTFKQTGNCSDINKPTKTNLTDEFPPVCCRAPRLLVPVGPRAPNLGVKIQLPENDFKIKSLFVYTTVETFLKAINLEDNYMELITENTLK